MNRMPGAVYAKELRDETVKPALTEGVGIAEAIRQLSIQLKSLASWIRAAKAGKLRDVGWHQKPLTERDRTGGSHDETRSPKRVRDVLQERIAIRHGVIEQMRQDYLAPPMYRLLGVSWSSPLNLRTRSTA